MEEGPESDSSLGDMLSEDATASLQLAQEDPSFVPVELRSRFNAAVDKSLLAEVLSTPPFHADRKEVKGVWKGIASRLNQSVSASFSFRACRDRTSLLLRKYAVQKKRNIAASGTSDVHTDDDDVLEQLQQLKDEAVTQTQTKKSITASKTQKVETAGQRLMQTAEQRVSERINAAEAGGSGKPKRLRPSALLESEQEEAAQRRKLEEQKIDLQRQELALHCDELEQQRRQHDLLREQVSHHAVQIESILKLLAAAISKKDS
ncbi:hypothetical protein PC129_g8480 [Phytophthora cactorum]|uniref:Uncharacterized protein n=3 Tax=Phytophthora cactorum TaxID=29920 RepID=A0A8T1I9I0_9STRA|nr:hypothetical protein PC114_g11532 [Phytophthora cactorum]KAG2920925.1 hypothetical protein PC115_g9677 [Phytophthora cactorum]KAG2938578.1 hypothetical protein PC117_g11169 [Phytophthora cactorum]KAG3084306.1 hypothetical protein PC122_g10211 [Phytophthora cactorum]KAG3220786.1 hypothetical protein PC129_g8480 [Phytophthora cactorum]